MCVHLDKDDTEHVNFQCCSYILANIHVHMHNRIDYDKEFYFVILKEMLDYTLIFQQLDNKIVTPFEIGDNEFYFVMGIT